MGHVNWMTLRFNNWEYTLTDQSYDWIRRFYTNRQTGEVEWDKLIKYFEEAHISKKEIKEEEDY